MQTMKKMSMAAASLTTFVSSSSGKVAAFWSRSCTVPHMFNSRGPCLSRINTIANTSHLVAVLAILVEYVGDHLSQVCPAHSFKHILTISISQPLAQRDCHGDNGEGTEGESHHAHHEPPGAQVHATAASLKANHPGTADESLPTFGHLSGHRWQLEGVCWQVGRCRWSRVCLVVVLVGESRSRGLCALPRCAAGSAQQPACPAHSAQLSCPAHTHHWPACLYGGGRPFQNIGQFASGVSDAG